MKKVIIAVWLRIACFLLCYICMMGIGVGIFAGLCWVLYHLIVTVLPESGKSFALVILAAIALCGIAISLAIYIIRPFIYCKKSDPSQVEVFESECPELFAMIRDVAAKIGTKMPKHVYLSTFVRARVFYNTCFWSIFFPVRKNLEIGLGLLDGTNVEEVKSVIAQVLAHGSRKGAKSGSKLYVTKEILDGLATYGESVVDVLSSESDSESDSDSGSGCTGCAFMLANLFILALRAPIILTYNFVQKGYMKLSEYIEYDADNVACQCAGSGNFVSALCKIDVLLTKDGIYDHLLYLLLEENSIVSHYFIGKRIVYDMIQHQEIPVLQYDEQLIPPTRNLEKYVRFKSQGGWPNHPSLEDRLEKASSQYYHEADSYRLIPAWELIPDAISEKVSTNMISLIIKSREEEISYISDEQFKEWAQETVSDILTDEGA